MYIDTASFSLSTRCNLACSYCYGRNKPDACMTPFVAESALQWLFDWKTSGPLDLSILFFGGEPLLNFDVMTLVVDVSKTLAKRTRKRVRYAMTTNATLLTDRTAEYIANNEIRTLVSIDGPAVFHDAQRKTASGQGSYDLVMRNYDNILRVGDAVRATIVPSAAGSVCECIEHLASLAFRRIIVHHDDMQHWDGRALAAYEKSTYEVGELYVYIIDNDFDVSIIPLDMAIRWALRPHDDKVMRAQLESPMCFAGGNFVEINTSGELFPCQRFSSMNDFRGVFRLGDVFSGFVNDDARDVRKIFLRRERRHCLGCDIPCGGCEMLGKCKGGCSAANWEFAMDMNMRLTYDRFMEMVYDNVAKAIIQRYRKAGNESLLWTRFGPEEARGRMVDGNGMCPYEIVALGDPCGDGGGE